MMDTMKRLGRGCLLVIISLFFCSLSGCIPDGGKVESVQKEVASPEPEPVKAAPPQRPAIEIQPVAETLSPEASEIYAYLLFIQALLDEDEAALLEVMPELAKNPMPLNVWLDGGVWLMQRKSPNSIVFLEKGLEANPDDVSLRILYSEALTEHKMPERAIKSMRDFLEAHPDEIDAKLELVSLLVKNRQFDEAQKLLDGIPSNISNPFVPYYQAETLLGMGKKSEAVPFLKKAIKNLPDFIDPLINLAAIYEEEGKYKDAVATYEKLIKLNVSPQELTLHLVNLALKQKQPDKGVQYIKKGPDSIPFKLRAANILLESRYYLQAETILKQIANKPGAPFEVYLLLADLVFEQRRNLAAAMSWLDHIKPGTPGAEKAALLKIQLLVEAGQIGNAIEAIDGDMIAYPDLSELWDMKIRLLAREKKMPQALTLAREAVAKWPDSTNLAFLLGSILDERGQKKEALTIMEDILEKQPENYQALNYVGFSLAEENRDIQRALELLTKADKLSPNQAYIVDSLAWALFRAGKGEEALREIRRAISLGDMPDPAIWEHYGDIAEQQGKKDEARKAYRKAIELKPANMESIRKRLSRL